MNARLTGFLPLRTRALGSPCLGVSHDKCYILICVSVYTACLLSPLSAFKSSCLSPALHNLTVCRMLFSSCVLYLGFVDLFWICRLKVFIRFGCFKPIAWIILFYFFVTPVSPSLHSLRLCVYQAASSCPTDTGASSMFSNSFFFPVDFILDTFY